MLRCSSNWLAKNDEKPASFDEEYGVLATPFVCLSFSNGNRCSFWAVECDHKPVWMKPFGRATRQSVETHNMIIPISSIRSPTHSVAAWLWKSTRKLESIRLTFTRMNLPCCSKHRIVTKPAIVSEKWWMTGAFVRASTLVSSLEVAK